MKYCYHIYDKESGKVLIPGCMAAAAIGYESCRCKEHDKEHSMKSIPITADSEEVEVLKIQLKAAEKYIKHLKKELNVRKEIRL